MASLYVVDPGCAVTVADERFSMSTVGIVERARLIVESTDGTCHDVGLRLPPDVQLGERKARVLMSDDTRRKLPIARWSVDPDDASGEFPLHAWEPPGLYGHRIAHLFVPELLERDRVQLDVERVWPIDRAIAWDVSDDRIAALSLTVDGVSLAADPPPTGALSDGLDWTAKGGPHLSVVVGPIGGGAPAPAVVPSPSSAPPPVQTRRSLAFRIPGGDVQAALYPGGKAVADVVDEVTFPATDAARPWWIQIPDNATEPVVTVAPSDAGTVWLRRLDGIAVVAPPSDELLKLTIAYTIPDPPVSGEEHARPGETLAFVASDPGGHVRRDGVFWLLADHNGQPVIPDRESIVKGLAWRFDSLAIPEPGLPIALKGHAHDEELLTSLRPALWSRVHVAALPGDPLFPRKLYAARKSEVMTPIEAALVLRLYALQSQIPAIWTLVRPADRGLGDPIGPQGYDEALLRVLWNDEVRWIDPGCPSCGPYEIRPNLLGAAALGPDATRTPDPVPGAVAVRIDGDQATFHLDGPDALALRIALEGAPKADRERLIAERYGGTGATLVSIDGLGDAGASITVVVARPAGFGDLLALGDRALPYESGVRWVDAPGVRSVDRPAAVGKGLIVGPRALSIDDGTAGPMAFEARVAGWADADAPIEVALDALTYSRAVDAGRVVETVRIVDRRIPEDDIARLAEVRAAPVLPAGRPTAIAAILAAPTTLSPRGGAPTAVASPIAVTLVAHNAATAAVRAAEATGKLGMVGADDVRALPCRAVFTGKKETTILVDHPFAATVAQRVPTAGEPVWIVETRDGWARIDVDGPASNVHHGGWIALADVAIADSDDPIALGDLPASKWAPVVGASTPTVAITAPLAVRGLTLPSGTAIEVSDNGLFTAIVVAHAEKLGGVDFPAMSRLVLSDRCAFESGSACYAVADGGALVTR